jgi:hypothetical protein
MKQIIRDFFKSNVSLIVRYVIVIAVCIIAFLLTGIYTRDNTSTLGIIITGFLTGLFLAMLFDVFVLAPASFKKKIKSLSADDAADVGNNYAEASKTGNIRFYKENWLMFFSYRKIHLVRYDEISSVNEKRNNLIVTLNDGKAAVMESNSEQNSALLMAALKDKNQNIKFLLNGQERKDSQ